MERFLGKYSSYFYALLRIVAGAMFAMHGTQKLFNVPPGRGVVPVASLMGAAAIIEIVCGVLIAIGLLTSFAAFIASGQMAVAYFMRHASKAPWPIVEGGGETAVLYCFLFLYIASRGSGPLSVDSITRRSRKGFLR